MFKKGLFGVSMLTMACLYGMLSIVVFLICIFVGAKMDFVLLVSIGIFILQFLVAPFFTDLTMKWFYKTDFKKDIPEYLHNFLEKSCKEHKMKYPKIGIIDDGAPNAFTYGRTKNDARIVLTRGIFELLDEDEVIAVVAHEMGHAVHYDMLFMTVAQLIPLILYYIFEVFTSNMDDDNNSSLAIIGFIAYIFYLVSQYVILWLSRTREYYADSFAIEETKNPNSLAEALVKIGYGLTTKTSDKKGKMSVSSPNTLGIFDAKTSKSLIVSSYDNGEVSKDNIKRAMRWEKWNIWAKWYEFFSTHPLISKRLEAISLRSKEFNQEPYIVFDEKKSESYVDDFLLEALLVLAPNILLIIGLILIVVYVVMKKTLLLDIVLFIPSVIFIIEFFKYCRSHKNKNYKEVKVADLLSEVKVSSVTCVPCILEGEVIGKGDPGCIFDEDFVLKDDTGIIFVDYRRVLKVMDLFTGLTKTKSLFGKKVKIKGWYRRSPVPYVQIYEMEVEGTNKKKRFYTYLVNKVMLMFLSFLAIILPIIYVFM